VVPPEGGDVDRFYLSGVKDPVAGFRIVRQEETEAETTGPREHLHDIKDRVSRRGMRGCGAGAGGLER